MSGVPASTYRLQLRPGFGFADAAAIAGYLATLGITHVYLSPILQAAPGSTHGYDVVDHSRISAELGGPEAFRGMAETFRRRGLGLIVDIVPNHMAVPVPESLNRQLWQVLCDGERSQYAHWFDVDWQALDGQLLLPILAVPLDDAICDITVDRQGAEPVLRYFDHVLPLREGTADLPLADVILAQHYRLAHWRAAATELNWRRFFDITSLIAVRVEHPGVFAATHGLVLNLLSDGLIDGLRVDHPDGLADPRGYLERLAETTGGRWVAAEKILTGTEELPADWRCAGTTGYDTLGVVGGVFADPAGRAPLTEAHTRFTRVSSGFAEVAQAAKRDTVRTGLAAEVARLTRLLTRLGDPGLDQLSFRDLRWVLTEILAGFPVYRAYVVPGEPPPRASAEFIERAGDLARRALPERLHPALDSVCGLLLGRRAHPAHRQPRGDRGEQAPGPAPQGELIIRFQQTCGAVMAKGVEDTAFYRWSRLAALNEVGGDPDRFGVSPAEFHAMAARLARDWPATLTTLSTHDTKRQEDVRARLAVLAELAWTWAKEVAQWHELAIRHGQPPEPDLEYLMWQTMAGAWPIGSARLTAYLQKAAREAKTRTSWAHPDTRYEAAVRAFAGAALGDSEISGRIDGFVAAIAPHARVNSLGAKLIQLTMPGVPDVYQGCEATGFALVDPDNRHSADFAGLRRLLAALDADPADPAGAAQSPDVRSAGPGTGLGHEKLLVTSRALRLRRAHPGWFAGSYEPLAAQGRAAEHVLAFLRGGRVAAVATRLPAGLARQGGWADTAVPLPDGPWRDVLTGASHDGPYPLLAALTRQLPVALLVQEGSLE